MYKQRLIMAVITGLFGFSAYAQMTESFALAIRTGTPENVQAAIDSGADVNARDKEGFTPLILAVALQADPDVVVTLLKAGANANTRDLRFDMTPLMWAARGNPSLKVIGALLSGGADVNAHDRNDVVSPTAVAADTIRDSTWAYMPNGTEFNTNWQQAFAEQSFDPALAAALRRELGPWPGPRLSAHEGLARTPTFQNNGVEAGERTREGMTALMEASSTNPNPDIVAALLNAGADARAVLPNPFVASAAPRVQQCGYYVRVGVGAGCFHEGSHALPRSLTRLNPVVLELGKWACEPIPRGQTSEDQARARAHISAMPWRLLILDDVKSSLFVWAPAGSRRQDCR